MRSDFKLQKLFLLLILSFSTLSGCNAAFNVPESASSPSPPNEQPQGSEAENTSPPEPSASPLSTPEKTDLEKIWDEFLTALSTNITNESEENFKAVQTKAQELSTLVGQQTELSGLKTYLGAVTSYKVDPNSAGAVYRTFNNDLVTYGLATKTLAIEGDVFTLLSDDNKQSTAQKVVEKLNAKYRSLLVSSSSTPGQVSPSINQTDSPTSPPVTPDPRNEVEIKWDNFLLALRTNITDESPENFEKVKQAATELQGLPGVPNDLLDAVINYQGDYPVHGTFNNDLVKNGLGIRDLEIGDPIKLLSKPEDKEGTAAKVAETLNNKYRSQLISSANEDSENNPGFQFLTVIKWIGIGTVVFLLVNRKLNIVPALNDYLPWPSPVNNLDTPSLQSASPTGIPHSSRELEQIKAKCSNYDYRIQEYDRKFKEYDRKFQEYDQQIKILTQAKNIPVRGEDVYYNQSYQGFSGAIQPYSTSSSIPTSPPESQNIYKQMISHTIAVEDKNITARRMGSGEYPFFVAATSRQAHLGIYQDPSGEVFLLPTKPKTNHEKLSSYFDLQGSYKDGDVEVIQPAIVILSGQGWELYQKGIVEFR